MNEAQIRAQFDMLIEQRNTAQNQVVNMAGEIALLKQKLEAATALLSDAVDNSSDVEQP